MRGSQVFAALVIIALVAMGLVYLEAHGYFRDQRPAAMGRLKPDANAPKAEPPEADQASLSAPNASGGMVGNLTPAPSPAAANAAPATGEIAPAAPAVGQPPTPAGSQPVATTINEPVTPTKVIYPTASSAASANVVIRPMAPPQAVEAQNASAGLAATNVNSQVSSKSKPAAASVQATAPATENATPAPDEHVRIIYKIVYVDAQGNACKATRVPVRTVSEPGRPRVHRVVRRRVETTDTSWIYGAQPAPATPRPMYAGTTSCSMMQPAANGGRMVTLPAGMTLNVALNQQLSTVDTPAGQEFQGYLVGPITYCGEVIVPAGATVQGMVARSHHRGASQEDEALLQLKLQGLNANGLSVPMSAFSSSRRQPGEVPYTTVDYMNDPNYVETARDSSHDVTLPAQSVVSFSLRSGAAVIF